MRVLLTGAAGFVGARVARELLARGHEVHALIRPASRLWRVHDLTDRLRLHGADLADGRRVRAVLADARPEVCVHAAWYAEPGEYLHARENLDCLRQGLRLIGELARAGCGHVVGVGTCAEYAPGDGPLTEDAPTGPETIYAAAKLALFLTGTRLAGRFGVGLTWARLFHLHGPGEDGRRLIPGLERALRAGEPFRAGSGEQVRDFLHADDAAAGLATLAERRPGGAVNVCSGEPVTVRDFVMSHARRLGRPDLVRFGELPPRGWDPPRLVGCNRRLRSLGWVPRGRDRFGAVESEPRPAPAAYSDGPAPWTPPAER